MIKDNILNSDRYFHLSEGIKKGLEWICCTNLDELQDGRYEINGDNLYASIQTYETKEDAKYEAHRKYIDIQFIISGSEKIGVININNCKTVIEYDSKKDIEFYDNLVKDNYIVLSKGDFAILYPDDAHKPSISDNEKQTVKKLVIKVAV